jgi:RNA polymerase sigma factor (TIGR02999 family)
MAGVVESQTITLWLQHWHAGDENGLGKVAETLYKDLKRLAGHYLKDERSSHTLAATALVHEVYLQLEGAQHIEWQDRAHFLSVAIRMMRRILIDHARCGKAAKRTPDQGMPASNRLRNTSIDIIGVDIALEKLSQQFPRHAKVVELRFFGGLENSEVAEVLQISLRTVEREWQFARAWLQKEITGGRV